jgi:hypothetical protein
MSKFRHAVMWAALALIVLLALLSVYGAFIGAERAQKFFNSLPLAVYWAALGLALLTGLVAFRRLIRVPGLLLMHAGCILILAGSVWGSQIGHKLSNKLSGVDKIQTGQMIIYEGESQNEVSLGDDDEVKELPFSIKLKDFRLEYYNTGYLHIQTRQGQRWRMPVEIGTEFPLGGDFGTVKVVRTFKNFKIGTEDGKSIPYDDPAPGSNPALEVQITQPDGKVTTQYVFELFPGHSHSQTKFLLSYRKTISDYVSELQIIEDDKVVAEKDIEVNHPLHFGGYHFYQSSYDAKAGQYTVLQVTSDTGLATVYAGYWMLCIGVVWHLWLRHMFKKTKLKSA